MVGAPLSGRVRAVRAHRSSLRGVVLLPAPLGEAIIVSRLADRSPATSGCHVVAVLPLRARLLRSMAMRSAGRAAELLWCRWVRYRPVPEVGWPQPEVAPASSGVVEARHSTLSPRETRRRLLNF